jgi:hypothetical protein
MENEMNTLLDQMKLDRVRNQAFYNEHDNEHYGWKEYQQYKNFEQTKVAKLVKRKEKNLIE